MPTPGPTDVVNAKLTPGEVVNNLGAVAIAGEKNLTKLNEQGRKLMDSVGGVEQFQKLHPEVKKQKAGIYKGFCMGGKAQGYALGGTVSPTDDLMNHPIGIGDLDTTKAPAMVNNTPMQSNAAQEINSAVQTQKAKQSVNPASKVGGQAGSAANANIPDIVGDTAPKIPEVGAQIPKITDTTGVQSTVGNIANVKDTGSTSKIGNATVNKVGNSYSDNTKTSQPTGASVSTSSGKPFDMSSPNNQLALANSQLRDMAYGGSTPEQAAPLMEKAKNLEGQLPKDFKAASIVGANPTSAGAMKAGVYKTLNPSEPKYLPETGPAKTSSGKPLVASEHELATMNNVLPNTTGGPTTLPADSSGMMPPMQSNIQGYAQGGTVKGGIFNGFNNTQGYDEGGKVRIRGGVTANVSDMKPTETEVNEANLAPKDTVQKEGTKPGIANLSETEKNIKAKPPIYDVAEVQPEHIEIANKATTPEESANEYRKYAAERNTSPVTKTPIQESIENNTGLGRGHPSNFKPMSAEETYKQKAIQAGQKRIENIKNPQSETAIASSEPQTTKSAWESTEPNKPLIPEGLKQGAKNIGSQLAEHTGALIKDPTNVAAIADVANQARLEKGLKGIGENKAGIYTKSEVPIRGALSAASRIGPEMAMRYIPKEGQENIKAARDYISALPEKASNALGNAATEYFNPDFANYDPNAKAKAKAKNEPVKKDIIPKDQVKAAPVEQPKEITKQPTNKIPVKENQGLPEDALTNVNQPQESGKGFVQGANGKAYSVTKEGIFKFDPANKSWSKMAGPSTGAPKQSEAATKAGTTDFWLNRGYTGGAAQYKQEQEDASKEAQIQNLRNIAMQGPNGNMDPVTFGNVKRQQHLAQQQLLELSGQQGRGAEHNLQARRLANEEANTAATREATAAEREFQHGHLNAQQALNEKKVEQQGKLAEAMLGEKQKAGENKQYTSTYLGQALKGTRNDIHNEMLNLDTNAYKNKLVHAHTDKDEAQDLANRYAKHKADTLAVLKKDTTPATKEALLQAWKKEYPNESLEQYLED